MVIKSMTPFSQSNRSLTVALLLLSVTLSLASTFNNINVESKSADMTLTETPVQDFLHTTIKFNPALEANITLWGDQFLKGSKMEQFLSQNSTECFDYLMNFYFREIPMMEIKFHYANFEDKLFNATMLLSNFSMDMMYCASLGEDIYTFVKQQIKAHDNFTTYTMALF